MRDSRRMWLFGTLIAVALAGTATLNGVSSSRAEPQRGEDRDYWRHHDGRWNYWHAADRRWYHTDGANWYTHNGKGWEPYRFDRNFGRENFERGDYRHPEGNVVLPRHDIYRPR